MKVHFTNHPLIQHKITIMRKIETSSKEFRELASEVAMLMCYEVTRDLPLKDIEIETPITKTTANVANKYINFIKSVFIGYLDTF